MLKKKLQLLTEQPQFFICIFSVGQLQFFLFLPSFRNLTFYVLVNSFCGNISAVYEVQIKHTCRKFLGFFFLESVQGGRAQRAQVLPLGPKMPRFLLLLYMGPLGPDRGWGPRAQPWVLSRLKKSRAKFKKIS